MALPRPGPIGRLLRLVLGAGLLYLVVDIVRQFPQLLDGANLANPLAWVGLGYVIYALPEVTAVAFSRAWPAGRVRLAAGALFVTAGLVDFVTGGNPNGGAVGITSGLLLALVLGVLAASFLVAAVVAAPG